MRSLLSAFIGYIDPVARLGNTSYSITFALIGTFLMAVLLEIKAYVVYQDPESIGAAAIYIFILLITFFSFHNGIRAGVASVLVTISYYFYIIASRNYQGAELEQAIIATFMLGVLYLVIALVIGWLKQTIDRLLEVESNNRRRLEYLVQQLPVGVIVTDKSGVVIHANSIVDILLDIDVFVGMNLLERLRSLLSDKNQPERELYAFLKHTIDKDREVLKKEIEVARDKGKVQYLQVSSATVTNIKNRVIAHAIVIDDITNQKEFELQKDDFISMASHEFKTPLTSLSLFIHALDKQLQGTKDKKALNLTQKIKKQSLRLQELVDEMLDISKIHSGTLTVNEEVFNLNELVSEVIDVFHYTSEHEIVFKNQADVMVKADKFRISQVLINLVGNAIKYSPVTSPISIKVFTESNEAIVSVRDEGIGIDTKAQEKIFERLFRVDNDLDKTYSGFGMGLYISKEIIKLHNKKIWVKSKRGGGSTFYFTLNMA